MSRRPRRGYGDLQQHVTRIGQARVVAIQKLLGLDAAEAQQFCQAAKGNLLSEVALQNEGFQNASGNLGAASQSFGDFIWHLYRDLHGKTLA